VVRVGFGGLGLGEGEECVDGVWGEAEGDLLTWEMGIGRSVIGTRMIFRIESG